MNYGRVHLLPKSMSEFFQKTSYLVLSIMDMVVFVMTINKCNIGVYDSPTVY